MNGKNTKPMRVFPEDEKYLKELAKMRYIKGKDKKEVSAARILKGYINLTKMDAKTKRILLESNFK